MALGSVVLVWATYKVQRYLTTTEKAFQGQETRNVDASANFNSTPEPRHRSYQRLPKPHPTQSGTQHPLPDSRMEAQLITHHPYIPNVEETTTSGSSKLKPPSRTLKLNRPPPGHGTTFRDLVVSSTLQTLYIASIQQYGFLHSSRY